MAELTPREAAAILLAVGFKPKEAVTMLAISRAEHGGGPIDTEAISPTNDFGWLQIHSAFDAGPPGWRDPKTNARLARAKYDVQGFDAWCTYYPTGCGGHAKGNPTHTRHVTYLRESIEPVMAVAKLPQHEADEIVKDVNEQLTGDPRGQMPDPLGGIRDVVDRLRGLIDFIGALFKGETWVRVLEVIGGLAALAGAVAIAVGPTVAEAAL